MTVQDRNLLCHQTIPDTLVFTTNKSEFQISRDDLQELPVSVPANVKQAMEHVSQLGIKNKFLGVNPDSHVRWNHACGVYTVGSIWLRSLYIDNRVPKRFTRSPFLEEKATCSLVGYALILHDYGHLFFSHLLEEALQSINWVPTRGASASLEYQVLSDRLASDETKKEVLACISDSMSGCSFDATANDVLDQILRLAFGWAGPPWTQAIVNGPLDADKIDYIRRDQHFLTTAGYPIQTHLNFGPCRNSRHQSTLPWLNEFLADQYVNHAGYLCLPGRSSVAAVDLWQERIWLYDRFYLAPAIRAGERIALEIIQHFLIRCVMSLKFAQRVMLDPLVQRHFDSNEIKGLSERMRISHSSIGCNSDVIEAKYQSVVHILSTLGRVFGAKDRRDWECLEFMERMVSESRQLGHPYYVLIKESWKHLCDLADSKIDLRRFASECIVGAPIEFPKARLKKLRESLRAFQHRYSGDVLIDTVSLPGVLSLPVIPGESNSRTKDMPFSGILVPKGTVAKWGHNSRQLEPLTREKVAGLDRGLARITVVAPGRVKNARSLYVFDQLLALLRQEDVPFEEVPL